MSGLVLLMRSAATARARVAGVVEGVAGVVVGAAVEAVEAVEVVAAVGVVEGVGALVSAVEAAVGVAAVAAVAMVVVGLELSVEHRASRGTVSCPSVIRTDDHAGQTCGKANTQHRCFFRLDDAWSAEFGDEVERPHWAELLRSGVAIFDLDYDAILSAMYALSASAEGECYRCVPADPGINAAALGASESVLPGIAPAEALHTFTLDSGASHCFFHDSTTLTPLPAPVLVRLADPFGGPVVARSSTVLPCPPVPSGSLSSPHLSLFSTNLVSAAAFHDAMVTTTTPGGSNLYTLPTEPPQTLLWHHRLGQPSLPRLRGMHSCLLISGLPRSLPPLLPSFASTCLPCIEGRQRAAPHSSSFPLMTAPLQTLHMDVWGPARVNGQGRERYFLLVVDDYTRYTTVFLLRSKGQVVDVLIPWICAFRLQFLERFCADLRVLRLLSDRGGKFSSNLFRDFCRGEGILQSFMLLDSPKQNGIAERRIGLVMEVARTSMIHAAAPHFLCPFAVRFTTIPRAVTSPLMTSLLMRRFPFTLNRSAPPPPPPLFFAPDPPPVDPLPPQDPVPSGVSQVDPLLGTMPVEVAIGSGAAPGGAFGGAEPEVVESEGSGSGGAERGGEEPGGAEPVGVEPRGAESEGVEPGGAESGGVESGGAASSGRLAGASPRLSPQQLREWLVRCACLQTGATGAEGAGVTTGAGGTGGTAATGPGGARTRGTRAARTGGVGGAGAGDPTEPGVAGAGGCGAGGAKAGGAGLQLPLQPASPLRAPSPYREQSSELIERSEPASRLVSPVRPAHCDPRSRPPPVPDTHAMALRPSSVPLRVPLPAPPESSLPEVPDPESDRAHATSPTVSRLLTTAVTDPSFESAATSALVAELLDFAAACRLDYATALVAESESTSAPSVGGECTLGTDVLQDTKEVFECLAAAVPHFASMLLAPEGDPDAPDIPTPRSYAEAITGPYSSQWQAAMDAEMASWKSTGTYVDEVPPPRANIVDGMWIFRRDYELHSLDFNTAFLQASLHEEIWLHRPPGFCIHRDSNPRPSLYGLREWHDTLRTTLAALGFAPSTSDPSVFLRTDTSLPSFYVLVYVDDLLFATADTEELTLVKSELQKRHTCIDLSPSVLRLPVLLARAHSSVYRQLALSSTFGRVRIAECTSITGLVLGGRGPVVLTGHADASSQGYTFSLGSGSVSWRSTRSSLVLSSCCKAEIYARAMAAQELRWLTYLLTDLGEQPRSPPQRGQLRLAYVATRAKTADIFTKALPPGDHQHFSTV
ncbi:unnamed protein product [Closterium sp. NIES-53]